MPINSVNNNDIKKKVTKNVKNHKCFDYTNSYAKSSVVTIPHKSKQITPEEKFKRYYSKNVVISTIISCILTLFAFGIYEKQGFRIAFFKVLPRHLIVNWHHILYSKHYHSNIDNIDDLKRSNHQVFVANEFKHYLNNFSRNYSIYLASDFCSCVLLNNLNATCVGRRDYEAATRYYLHMSKETVADFNETQLMLLEKFGVTRIAHLSKREQQWYSLTMDLAHAVQVANSKIATLKKLKTLQKLPWNQINNLPESIQTFVLGQVKNATKNAYARQWSLEDKLTFYAIKKHSNVAYQFLSQIFCVPCEETIRKFGADIVFKPGHNEAIYKSIAERARRKGWSLLSYLNFDETFIRADLEYDPASGTIYGVTDNGSVREQTIANHALVFMLKSITGQWKQPVYYSFCRSSSSTSEIKTAYVDVVRKAKAAGIKVIGSVCDQGATNVSAMKQLSKETRCFRHDVETDEIIITVDGHNIFHVYDIPHLIKNLRNNLLVKNLIFQLPGQIEREACWDHIVMGYDIDRIKNSKKYRELSKLTELHVRAKLIPKMKVKYATQVFSNTVGKRIRAMAIDKASIKNKNNDIIKEMPPEGEHTGELLIFINEVFDSLQCQKISTSSSDDMWNKYKNVFKWHMKSDY
ncbi:uncharacterized protein LOC122850388 [Aphidius gifuensis]|uniref:uncharacterized protein LOC122850388 n=1 Tax=Aphidius gifuensis TaxID=684658 RepID=UPI001CDBC93F|nr:uncharacterized protein LOC122850388 [Aphidius gifuensis]